MEIQITSKWLQIIPLKLPTLFLQIWRSHFISLMNSLSCLKFLNLKIFQMEIQIIFEPLSISLNGRSHIIFTLGFCDEINSNSWRSKCKMKVLGKSFYSLSFNFQKVLNWTQFHSIISHNNQTNNQSYLFNITFQNLEFRDVTNYHP